MSFDRFDPGAGVGGFFLHMVFDVIPHFADPR
jgi:hypothetical protein